MATTPLSTRVLLYPFPTRARSRYSASRRAEVVSDAYRDARDVAVAPPRLSRVGTRAIRPVEPSARLLSKRTRRFSAAANSSAGSLPPARGCRHASSASVQKPARSHVAAPDPPRLLRLRRARRSRRSAPRRRRLTPRRPSRDENRKPNQPTRAMTTTRAHRLATMSTVASTITVAVCFIFGDVFDAAPRARASARRQGRKRRCSDTGSDTPAVFFAPASRALGRAAPCLAVIVLAALFTTARADGEPVAAGRSTPVAQARGGATANPRASQPRSAGAIFPWTFPEHSFFGGDREGPRLRSDRLSPDAPRHMPIRSTSLPTSQPVTLALRPPLVLPSPETPPTTPKAE